MPRASDVHVQIREEGGESSCMWLRGVDCAIFPEKWIYFRWPRKTIRKGDPEDPMIGSCGVAGHLELRIWFLGS